MDERLWTKHNQVTLLFSGMCLFNRCTDELVSHGTCCIVVTSVVVQVEYRPLGDVHFSVSTAASLMAHLCLCSDQTLLPSAAYLLLQLLLLLPRVILWSHMDKRRQAGNKQPFCPPHRPPVTERRRGGWGMKYTGYLITQN